MAEPGITYSRVVAWLKIVLPIAALGLLSTLFLFARDRDLSGNVPFAKIDLEERARDPQLTAPHFSGLTSTGHRIAVTAGAARPDPVNPQEILITEMNARIDLTSGANVNLMAGAGRFDSGKGEILLSDGVAVETSMGLTLHTLEVRAGIHELFAESAGQITGQGPFGAFSAGKMTLRSGDDDGAVYLVFTNGVKLVYTRQE